ncbi:MAG: AAA family ATPase [Actinomycetota bacterium]|nr:AAA family ATPase [Actinomycetota bacterium]
MAPGRLDEDSEWIPVEATEWTRGEKLSPDREIVKLRYRLDRDEQKILRNLENGDRLRKVRWLERTLHVDGSSSISLEPIPTRNKEPRWALAKALRRAIDQDDWPAGEEIEDTVLGPENLEELLSALESNLVSLSGHLESLDSLAGQLEEHEWEQGLVEKIRHVYELELRNHPHPEGRGALLERIPKFVRFEMADRQLADEYDLATAADDPPPALHNLAELAELDLEELLEQINSGLTGSVRATIDKANEVLREVFGAWTQKPSVAVSFDRSGTSLLVHVQSGTGVPMKPHERSEGLRQFVGLVALTAGEGHGVPPILLIDEAEMHLHYDAQADLMDTLAKQNTAAQIIYTTHSSACLPEDLGSSVRIVRGVGEEMRSEVEQQFWSDEVGLVPLLLAMGAGSMAFAPLRPAVIAEGGSELVLLPSLIKEAARIKRLGYQVVPGAAGSPPLRIAGLDLEGVSTVWVLDGDQGGRDRRKYLSKNGVPRDRIHLIEEGSLGLDLEDLIHPETYVKAVNRYAEDLGGRGDFSVELLPANPCGKHKAVSAWCAKLKIKEPGKTAIANKVLDFRGEEPLSHPDRHELLRDLHKTLRQQLKVR